MKLKGGLMRQIVCQCGVKHSSHYINMGSGRSVSDIRSALIRQLSDHGMDNLHLRFLRLYHYPLSGRQRSWKDARSKCVVRPPETSCVRRKGEDILICYRERKGHHCDATVTIITMTIFDSVSPQFADFLYEVLCRTLPGNVKKMKRGSPDGPKEGCPCNVSAGGAHSVGCQQEQGQGHCSFPRRRVENKHGRFMLEEVTEENVLKAKEAEDAVCGLCDLVGPWVEVLVPQIFQEQAQYSSLAEDCRLGKDTPIEKRIFSSSTAVMSRSVHIHR